MSHQDNNIKAASLFSESLRTFGVSEHYTHNTLFLDDEITEKIWANNASKNFYSNPHILTEIAFTRLGHQRGASSFSHPYDKNVWQKALERTRTGAADDMRSGAPNFSIRESGLKTEILQNIYADHGITEEKIEAAQKKLVEECQVGSGELLSSIVKYTHEEAYGKDRTQELIKTIGGRHHDLKQAISENMAPKSKKNFSHFLKRIFD